MWGDGSRVAKEINGDHSNAVGFREGVWAAEPPSVHWFISLSATGRQSTGMSTEGWGRFIPLFCLLIKGHEKLHGVIIIIKKRYSKKKLETFLLLLLLETFLAPQCFIFYFWTVPRHWCHFVFCHCFTLPSQTDLSAFRHWTLALLTWQNVHQVFHE